MTARNHFTGASQWIEVAAGEYNAELELTEGPTLPYSVGTMQFALDHKEMVPELTNGDRKFLRTVLANKPSVA